MHRNKIELFHRRNAAEWCRTSPASKVLASLLNGSQFNYVMVGRSDNPHQLAQVTLTPKPAELASAKNSAAPRSRPDNAVAAQVNSNRPQVKTPDQVDSAPPVAAANAPEKEANFVSDLAAELGPEAANMDPAERRALETILAQMNKAAQMSNQGTSDSQNAAQEPSPAGGDGSGANTNPTNLPAIPKRRGRR